MRKIESKESLEKKKKRNNTIIGILLVIIMILSTLGYAFYENNKETTTTKKIKYGGFDFVEQNGFWITTSGDLNFAFTNDPRNITITNSEVDYLNKYYNEPLYVYSEDDLALSEIYNNLNQVAQRMQPACLNGSICNDKTLPIKTCKDNFIIIKEGNFSEIKQEDNCVFIQGPEEELVKITDGFLLKIIGSRTA